MKKLITCIALLACCWQTFSQIEIKWKYQGTNTDPGVPEKIKEDDVLTITVGDLADVNEFDAFVKNSSVTVDSQAAVTFETFLNDSYKTNYANYRTAHKIDKINLLEHIQGFENVKKITLELKEKTTSKKFSIEFETPPPPAPTEVNNAGDLSTEEIQKLENWLIHFEPKDAGTSVADIYNLESRYENELDRAYLLVDANGNLIGNSPVNIDQDDIIYVIAVGQKNLIDKLNVDFIGSYVPADLQMRNFAPIVSGVIKANKDGDDKFTVKVFRRGPFTSETVTVKIKSGGNLLAAYGLRTNKLFNVGFGVGFNITDLQSPEYELRALSTTSNTIVTKNEGKRTLVSVNAIWYWRSTFRYLFPGSHITRGRDVLKEPSFWERINPSFGVSLDGDFKKNLFFAGNFEFARGGSINLGYHWGKVTRLNIDNFVLGETEYTGATIPTTEEWNGRFFIGIMLDTRILNTLFNARR